MKSTTGESLRARVSNVIMGEVTDAAEDRMRYSRDTSLFHRTPSLVVFPKNAQDVSELIKFVHRAKQNGENIALTARSAGTDMTGGPLTSSIVAVFTKYMNHVISVKNGEAVTEPGVYYRDFEKQTLLKGLILPSYPASREICAMGGIVSNNSGGERTLSYGKTNRYVRELDVVLSDGSQVVFRPLNEQELEAKKAEQTLEGDIYRKMHALIQAHREEIKKAKPNVTKNAAGYALWNIIDEEKKTFDLTQLITGSQGTLGIVTKIKLELVRPKKYRAMAVAFLSDLKILPEIVHRVLKIGPESFESYDDHTLKLAMRFFPQLLKQLGWHKAVHLGIAFIPEMTMVLRGGIPKLVLMAEFAEQSQEKATQKAKQALEALKDLPIQTRLAAGGMETEKYWMIRRESFSLLRKNLKGLYAAPFIDDIIVPPDNYPEFFPKLTAMLDASGIIYTIAGHVGDGNLHIIPLMDISKPQTRRLITQLTEKVYRLVVQYGGSITGEHNDGIIRTPYLSLMFGEKMVELFAETKHIFDPLNILNPGKKVGGTMKDIDDDMIHGR